MPVVAPGWPIIDRASPGLVNKFKQPGIRLAISGRRRVGKSFLVCTMAHQHLKGTVPVLYLMAPASKDQQLKIDFIEEVHRKIVEFDPSIELAPPGDVKDVIFLLGWLLKSKVWVIIDEFQRLTSLSHLFQVLNNYLRFFPFTSLVY
jgi:hypothetical protein